MTLAQTALLRLPPALVLLDNFDRANAAALGTASGGGVWTEASGSWAITSNKAQPTAGEGVATIPVATAIDQGVPVRLSAELTVPTEDFWAGFAIGNDTDHIAVAVRSLADDRSILVRARVASVDTDHVIDGYGPESFITPNSTFTLTVDFVEQGNGDMEVHVFIGFNRFFVVTLPAGQWEGPGASTEMGLYALTDGTYVSTPSVRWENFQYSDEDPLVSAGVQSDLEAPTPVVSTYWPINGRDYLTNHLGRPHPWDGITFDDCRIWWIT